MKADLGALQMFRIPRNIKLVEQHEKTLNTFNLKDFACIIKTDKLHYFNSFLLLFDHKSANMQTI